MTYSARSLLGLPVLAANHPATPRLIGTIEAVVLNPVTFVVDGFLLGHAGQSEEQYFLPSESVTDIAERGITAHDTTIRRPPAARRIIGLPAWTIEPRFFVGFVYDFDFNLDNRMVESFAIHQLIRTWRIPATAVAKITVKSLLINNDTTVKLKLTPYPSKGA